MSIIGEGEEFNRRKTKENFMLSRRERLLAESKNPFELIEPIILIVRSVKSADIPVKIVYPISKSGIVGPGYDKFLENTYVDSFKRGLEIKVGGHSIIKKLKFLRYTPACTDDKITAYVVKARKEIIEVSSPINCFNRFGTSLQEIYLPGKFKEEMIALRIDLDEKGRSDWGINYDGERKIVSEPFLF